MGEPLSMQQSNGMQIVRCARQQLNMAGDASVIVQRHCSWTAPLPLRVLSGHCAFHVAAHNDTADELLEEICEKLGIDHRE
eukprot:2130813-Amphidinium_carterae.1